MDRHNSTVSQISSKVRELYHRNIPFRIYHGSTVSTRSSERDRNRVVDVSPLSNVLEFDMQRKTVLVEPNVPMDALVDATLAKGLLPQVVMEFPNITVGGGFSGMSGESSSFRYSLFDHSIKSIELVLGNGTVIKASPEDANTSDLFFQCAGSCGSLGVVTLLEMQLMDAKPYVELTYIPVSSVSDSLKTLRRAEADPTVDYMDGIFSSSTSGVILIGRLRERPITGRNPQTFDKASDPWFYLHAEQILNNTKDQVVPYTESIPIKSYLFRYDRGVFWASSRAFRYFHMPLNRITRYLLDPLINTRIMFHALHKSRMAWRGFIQDLAVPYSASQSLIEFTEERTGIWPLWICPVKLPPSGRRSFAFGKRDMPEMLLNVGIWGFGPQNRHDAIQLNREFEAKVDKLGGVKVLYAHAYYTEDEFWGIYDEKGYQVLRRKYHAESLPNVYDKIKVDLKTSSGDTLSEKIWDTWPFAGLYGLASAMKKLILENGFVGRK
ncbi:24-dehydrocholesterol reductase-like protein precursor [Delitschia confertaspora ATCC 74209]|uniref:Delta(24)-sterol reductase n=1 Tax=Delitschia confertaspora ATCC 74209 TaxID=1513339 RepID=A0A9P4JSM0_9PLEO|nr:24-dehydrocholesterol reductase-like protein precursor [Delitschia confertaspora ATCC 74209]